MSLAHSLRYTDKQAAKDVVVFPTPPLPENTQIDLIGKPSSCENRQRVPMNLSRSACRDFGFLRS